MLFGRQMTRVQLQSIDHFPILSLHLRAQSKGKLANYKLELALNYNPTLTQSDGGVV